MSRAITPRRKNTADSRGITPTRVLLVFALPLTFGTFAFFPGMQLMQNVWYAICFLCLIFVYPIWKALAGLRFTLFEIYVLILICFNALMPSLRAAQVFRQPLIYGLLAQRSCVVSIVPLLVFLALKSRRLRLADIKWAMLFLAWGLLIINCFMRFFVNPAIFSSDSPGFISVDKDGLATFTLPTDFLIFGLIYYMLRGLRQRSLRDYAIAAIFFFEIIVIADARALVVTAIGVFIYSAYRLYPKLQVFGILIKASVTAAVALTLAFVISPTYISDRLSGFRDAFAVAFTGAGVENASANVRILEAATAIPYIRSHPFLGNGNLSHQWQGGTGAFIGRFFYADDIGVIGIIFTIGILGLLLFAYQFRYAIWASNRISYPVRNPLIDATIGVLIFSAVISLSTGVFAFMPQITLFYIVVMIGQVMVERNDQAQFVQSKTAESSTDLEKGS